VRILKRFRGTSGSVKIDAVCGIGVREDWRWPRCGVRWCELMVIERLREGGGDDEDSYF
jgi:hypothetical protein